MIFLGDFGTQLGDNVSPLSYHAEILGTVASCSAFAPPFIYRAGTCASAPHAGRSENERRSRQVRAGLLLLLASCGWIIGGEEGAKRAVAQGESFRSPIPASQNASHEHYALRTLSLADAPDLFAEIDRVCWHAKLPRRPQVCVLVGQRAMNAYALGSPDLAVVTFTEGLLAGMTTKEAAAIFAHEIAHICNGDSSVMMWAAGFRRAINEVCAQGLAACQLPGGEKIAHSSLRWLLERAPAIAELLTLALSRFREIEADAFALELTGDVKTLERALAKLEQHHRVLNGIPESYVENRISSYLRSHPVTSERIGRLRGSPLYGAA